MEGNSESNSAERKFFPIPIPIKMTAIPIQFRLETCLSQIPIAELELARNSNCGAESAAALPERDAPRRASAPTYRLRDLGGRRAHVDRVVRAAALVAEATVSDDHHEAAGVEHRADRRVLLEVEQRVVDEALDVVDADRHARLAHLDNTGAASRST